MKPSVKLMNLTMDFQDDVGQLTIYLCWLASHRDMLMLSVIRCVYATWSIQWRLILVNRQISFYEWINQGWSGRVIDTMRILYSSTYYRVKVNDQISLRIDNHVDVNQGRNVSGLLFHKCMADLSEYLYREVGICLADSIVAHLLWTDDLILLYDSVSELQKQLKVLSGFLSYNMMIVNEMRTTVMVYGPGNRNFSLKFNGRYRRWVQIPVQYNTSYINGMGFGLAPTINIFVIKLDNHSLLCLSD